jgi:hypothetical protein
MEVILYYFQPKLAFILTLYNLFLTKNYYYIILSIVIYYDEYKIYYYYLLFWEILFWIDLMCLGINLILKNNNNNNNN